MNKTPPAAKEGSDRDKPESVGNRATWRRHRDPVDRGILCSHANVCGVCRYVNGNYRESLDHKYNNQLKLFDQIPAFSRTRVTGATPAPQSDRYRCHAKLAVRSTDACVNPDYSESRFKIGLLQKPSNKVFDLPQCPLHRPAIDRLLREIRPLLDESTLQPFNAAKGEGDLRMIAVRTAHLTSEIMLTFVTTSDVRKELKGVMSGLRLAGHNVSAAYMNIVPPADDAVFGEDTVHIAGSQRLRERVCGIEFAVSPRSFFQVNPAQAEVLWRRVATLAGEDSPSECAWDLYSGVGAISLVLAEQGFRVLGIEENPDAVRDAQYNSQKIAAEKTPFYLCGRIENQMVMLPAWAQDPKVIVANPPRRGMDEPVRQLVADTLLENDDRRFIYIAAEAKTLVRDIVDLTKRGLQLRQLEAFDMFPYTEKLDWVAVLTR